MATQLHFKFAGNRRDSFQLILNLLEVAKNPVKKTHILYRVGMNFSQLEKYLEMLQSMDLIEVVETPFRGYRTTENGETLINILKK